MNVVGLILAGGSGSRLGLVRKSNLRLGGQKLIDRVVQRFSGHVSQILISTGRNTTMPERTELCIADTDLTLGGPLAGLAAAAQHLSSDAPPDTVVVTVAVDTPLLPTDYIPRLLAALDGSQDAVQSAWRGNVYPTNAAWRLPALQAVMPELIGGSEIRSPKRLLQALGAPVVDWADSHAEDPFANINTIEDMVALARRIGSDAT
jgi:molybdopterin-guanine dinucleotide biosynthesis protein A